MRQSSNSGRRLRGRPNRNKSHGGTPNRNSTFESNGPEGKVRGNAAQVFEKYLALAREASAGGNRIGAEAFYQHAEHYFRIMNDSTDPRAEGQQGQGGGRDGQRQPYRNGADGDGRYGGGGLSDDSDQGDDYASPPARQETGGERPSGERPSGDRPSGDRSADDRQPRARTPRDQLRRGRAQRNQGGDYSQSPEPQAGAAESNEPAAQAGPQENPVTDAPTKAAADSDGGRNPAADRAPNGGESETESATANRGRGRKASNEADDGPAPRRGRPRKAKAADGDEPAATGESGESAA